MVFTLTDLSCLVLSTGTTLFVVRQSSFSFQKHTLNIYSYMMLVFLVCGLFGKSITV